MKRTELESAMARLEKEILPSQLAMLSSNKEQLQNAGFDVFCEFIKTLASSIRLKYSEMIEVLDFQQIASLEQIVFWAFVASNLNSVLYPSYPYIFALGYANDDQEFSFTVSTRQLIESYHRIIPLTAIPVLYGERREDLSRGDLNSVKLIRDPADFFDFIY